MERRTLAAFATAAALIGGVSYSKAAPDAVLAGILGQARQLDVPAIKTSQALVLKAGYSLPDESRTPGVLCTAEDPNFSEYRYPEHIPYCQRNLSQEDKKQVADSYGVPWEDRSQYEFDHRIPLCMGGSNDLRNIWPQPLDEAKVKDRLEDSLCNEMKNGSISQKDAVERMLSWSENSK